MGTAFRLRKRGRKAAAGPRNRAAPRGRKPMPVKPRYITLPNMLTLGNLVSGSVALWYVAVLGRPDTAFLLVGLAVAFDFFDGFAARLTRTSSPLGVQLDSLADMVSSGLTPAAQLWWLYTYAGGECAWFGAGAALCVTACSALRLARFNIDPGQHSGFIGMPTPACALLAGALGWIAVRHGLPAGLPPWAFPALALALAWLLVSPLRMFSLKFEGFGWRGNEVRYSFLAASAVLLAVWGPSGVAAVIILYILASAALAVLCRRKRG